MPKYIKKRPGPKPKPHKVIQGIEHKHCGGICKKWKPLDQFAKMGNGKQSYCKPCSKKKNKQRRKVIKEKRKQVREAAPTGFLVCLKATCIVKGLQPVDQFIGPHVRNEEPTSHCKTCRDKTEEDKEQRQAACKKVWDDWRLIHPCVICINDPEHVHNPLLIEADHLGEKVKKCSDHWYWSHSKRGPLALQAELMTVQALCRFHHRLVTQQRNHDNGRIQKKPCKLRKRAVINKEKHKRGCCSNPKCKRPVKEGEECAFDLDHRNSNTKFEYKGKGKSPAAFVDLPDALFDKQWPLEQAKCDLLCANCHALKKNRDGYRK